LHAHHGQVFAGTFVAIQFAGNNHLRRRAVPGTILIVVIILLLPSALPSRLAGLA
jgi:hypothetical protein